MILDLMKERRLRKKVYFTLLVLLFCSALTAIPVYGVNITYLELLFGDSSMLTFLDAISGGAMARLSISGFGVSSYITASIVIQLASVVFPKIERIRKEGEYGKQFTKRIQLILSMIFTFIGSVTLAVMCGRGGLFTHNNFLTAAIAVGSWMLGSFITIYLAEKIDDYGIGTGITILLSFNILSRFPNSIIAFYQDYVAIQTDRLTAGLYIAGLVAGMLFFYLLTIYLEKGLLYVPLIQSKKESSVMNSDGSIPISVNISSVLPVVYASSLLALPNMFVSILGIETEGKISKILEVLDSTNWYTFERWYYPAGLVLYVILIIFFSYISSKMNFSAEELADNMKKNGDVIANVAPGDDTVKYLEKRRKVMTTLNILFLLAIVILPEFLCVQLGIRGFSFLGTSLIIVVAMLCDTGLKIRAESIHNSKKHRLFPKGGGNRHGMVQEKEG